MIESIITYLIMVLIIYSIISIGIDIIDSLNEKIPYHLIVKEKNNENIINNNND